MNHIINISEPLPLFVMPSVVLFPGADLPLFIQQPTYEAMLLDAAEGNGLVAFALQKSRFADIDNHGVPLDRIHRIGCIGRIAAHRSMNGGGISAYIRGTRKIMLLDEASSFPYRRVFVEILNEDNDQLELMRIFDAREDIMRLFMDSSIQNLLDPIPRGTLDRISQVSIENFVPLAAALLRLTPSERQQLLEDDPLQRMERLLDRFREKLLYSTTLGDGMHYLLGEEMTH